jgi:HAMP domain-containing protein
MLGAALILIVLPLTWLLIRSIVEPIRKLTDVAEQFSRGRIDLDIPYKDYGNEIGKLANALNRLGMSIKMAAERLKHTIAKIERLAPCSSLVDIRDDPTKCSERGGLNLDMKIEIDETAMDYLRKRGEYILTIDLRTEGC